MRSFPCGERFTFAQSQWRIHPLSYGGFDHDGWINIGEYLDYNTNIGCRATRPFQMLCFRFTGNASCLIFNHIDVTWRFMKYNHDMQCHDDVMKWKQFPRYWPFVRGVHRSPKGQWRGALMLSSICVWINGCVNNHEAGDLRRHSAHYDVIVMLPHCFSN